ncbi:uncharacterized protein PHACADRAFT_131351 [Phanerochaete carnosa HHB-10118-sp]|uniref:F-box domain-containing protein n=1 Tax=Phanerochaete carnosa (strain HHB-10118-sp) TaxID=650164 RepID=K5UJ92_PHACS|nr:uncharacterized protein PHACADRAFT_131351 [Phanerochaete carnosa HHB-10118-sp]EKM49636.1 hypothetical protein PHACADRAFT_131351 [Phanerochaete carnosa HHB-10118-sp]
MSVKDLPEELLREILSACLDVSLADFFRFPTLTDNAGHPPRHADLLLASKQWLRIGAPLLYSSLRLCSPSHAAEVARLLSASPGLGSAIVNLRIEENCGSSLVEIVKCAPRVQRLYISVCHMSSHDVEHLRQALPHILPKQLFLVDMTRVMRFFTLFPWPPGTKADEALHVVEHTIAHHWTMLQSIHFGPCFPITPTTSLALDQAVQGRLPGEKNPLQIVCWDLDGSSNRVTAGTSRPSPKR